ncbi:chromate transporter [Emticicia sp. C21]|uniref:chromate transporter n=1 Tax=Emticicia sp. C21 TaxID=2302915 RepID=UPI000E3573C2|nr:chromate transporter [Emticicia sp. C21]RFS13526.1 chromate transporter [Emticicia sp. C21]
MTTPYTLKQLILYFLKLGTTGFGGPIALVGTMHKDLVEKRKWISEEEYKQGLVLAQLAPGPLAAQLGIYLGYVHKGVLGATLAGIAFVLPSFIMVVLLGITYEMYGELKWMQAVFYGVGAAVVGIILMSTYKLTIKSVGKFNVESIRTNTLLWILLIIAAITTYLTKQENIVLFIVAGLLYMFIKVPVSLSKSSGTNLFFLPMPFLSFEWSTLGEIAIFFAKAGAFIFGSGLAIVPFLHAGIVVEHQWLTEQQFLDAVAIAMITPGPVVITVAFIGYLVGGFPGACIAALATFLPCYLFTVIPAPYFKKISGNRSVKAFVDGITATVVGSLIGAVVVIASGNIVDLITALIAVFSAFIIYHIKQNAELYIIFFASLTGVLLKLF